MAGRMLRAIVRLILFLLVLIIFLLLGVLIGILVRPFGLKKHRQISTSLVPVWATIMCAILGVHVTLRHVDRLTRGANYFIVANHLSYLDVILICRYFPVLLVGKQEVKKWPLLGTLGWLGGMVFIDRNLRGAVHRPYIGHIADLLTLGFSVVVFPEGTSSNGDDVLPFKKTIFSCPIQAGVPILPVTIRYLALDGKPITPINRDRVCWYGDMTFVDHFWKFLMIKRFETELIVQPPFVEKQEADSVVQNARVSLKAYQRVRGGYKV